MAEPLSGKKLAESAHLLLRHRDRYRSGIEIDELVKLLEASGIQIAGADPWSTLRSALNMAQNTWVRGDNATWIPVSEVRPVGQLTRPPLRRPPGCTPGGGCPTGRCG